LKKKPIFQKWIHHESLPSIYEKQSTFLMESFGLLLLHFRKERQLRQEMPLVVLVVLVASSSGYAPAGADLQSAPFNLGFLIPFKL